MMLRFTLILLTQMIFTRAQSQQSITLPFETLTINDGLSQGFVSSIIQDKMGFMWFGTNDGLNRYDGYKFTVYYHNPFDSTSLADNEISCLYEDSNERLWIGTKHSGIDIFDRQRLQFIHLKHCNKNSLAGNGILSINQDRSGAFWITTDRGIDHLSVSNKNTDKNMESFFANHNLQFTHIELLYHPETNRIFISGPRLYVNQF